MSLLLALPAVRHGITRFVQRFLRQWMRRTPGKISESDWISTALLSSSSNAVVACRVLHFYRAVTPMRQAVGRLASTHVARRQRFEQRFGPFPLDEQQRHEQSRDAAVNGEARQRNHTRNRAEHEAGSDPRWALREAGRIARSCSDALRGMRPTVTASLPNAIEHSRLAGMQPGA